MLKHYIGSCCIPQHFILKTYNFWDAEVESKVQC